MLQYAEGHQVIAALLRICPKHRRGCYTVPTIDIMNALGCPMSQVHSKSSLHSDAASARLTSAKEWLTAEPQKPKLRCAWVVPVPDLCC